MFKESKATRRHRESVAAPLPWFIPGVPFPDWQPHQNEQERRDCELCASLARLWPDLPSGGETCLPQPLQ